MTPDPIAANEQSLLGALLLDNAGRGKLNGFDAKYFASDQHRVIYHAIVDQIDDDGIADTVTVFERLQRNGTAERAGGLPYLHTLAQNTPSGAHVEHYAAAVEKAARGRKIAAALAEAQVAVDRGDLDGAGRVIAGIETQRKTAAVPMDWRALGQLEPPPRDWLVQDWITGGLTLFAGRGGLGKSLLSQQWGTALALARDFIGCIPISRKVLYWNCEDDVDELWRRQKALCDHFGISLADVADRFFLIPRLGANNVMMTTSYGTPALTSVIGELSADVVKYRAEFVLIDNISCIFAANNSDPGHVRMFCNALTGALRVPVGLVGHTARSAGSEFSGSTQWEAAARTRLYMGPTLPDQQPDADAEPTDDAVVYLARRKANYTSRDWVKLRFDCGAFVPDQPVPTEGTLSKELRAMQARRVVMHGFDKLVAMGRQPTDGKTSQEYLPRLIVEFKFNEGLSKREIGAAMRELMVDGKLKRGMVGRDASRHPKNGLIKT